MQMQLQRGDPSSPTDTKALAGRQYPTAGKRIRDATLHTFIYHYIFAAKSKSLII